MAYRSFSKFGYDDFSYYIMELITQNKINKKGIIRDQINGKIKLPPKKITEERISKLKDAGFIYKDRNRLTKNGEDHLYQAINLARDENRSALNYTGIIMGFTIAFFGLLLIGNEYNNIYAVLHIYLLGCLFVTISLSLLSGFCFWHGCSRDHSWKDLRLLNEMGDAIIIFSGWILLYTIYLAMYLNLSNSKFLIEITTFAGMAKNLSIIYFLIPVIVGLIMMVLSRCASKQEDGLEPKSVINVIYEFIYTSAFLFSRGKRFYPTYELSWYGWIPLVASSTLFSAVPIIIIILLK